MKSGRNACAVLTTENDVASFCTHSMIVTYVSTCYGNEVIAYWFKFFM